MTDGQATLAPWADSWDCGIDAPDNLDTLRIAPRDITEAAWNCETLFEVCREVRAERRKVKQAMFRLGIDHWVRRPSKADVIAAGRAEA